MAFENMRMGRQKVLYNNTNDDLALVYQLNVEGEKVTPTSATIAVFKPGSSTAVLAATAMTVSGTLLTYNLDTTTVADFPLDEGFRADMVITYGGNTYNRHLIFDVASYHLSLKVNFDKLIALDRNLLGAEHNGDEDLSNFIEACRDNFQTVIEQRLVGVQRLKENFVLDDSMMNTIFRDFVLAQYYLNDNNIDKMETYEGRWKSSFNSVMASASLDVDEDGEEEAPDGVAMQRLVM